MEKRVQGTPMGARASADGQKATREAETCAVRGRPSRRRTVGVLAVALGFALPSWVAAKCQVQSVELPVKMVGSRAVATVEINGKSVPLTVDSGAFYSMLTEAAAAQLELKMDRNSSVRVTGFSNQVLTARTTTVDKLTLLKGDISKVTFIVGGNEPGAGTLGLMGRNVLAVTDTEYDLAHGMIRFLFPNDDCAKVGMAYWAGDKPVSEFDLVDDYRSKTPALKARAKLNGNTVMALFDTGATTMVSTRAARSSGIAESDWKEAGFGYGIAQGTMKRWIAPFKRFELGTEAISNGRLPVEDFQLDDAEIVLGIDYFLSHRIYVSRQQSKMYMTYAGGPVFALDRVAPATGTATGDGTPPPTASGDAQAATADELARRAAASAARRDFESALADLDRACELEPNSGAHLAQRASVQAALRHPAKAMEDFDRALQLEPTLTDARFQRAVLRIGTKDRDGARSDLDELDHALPAQAQLRLAMATLYLAVEQPAQTVAQLDQWLKAHPNEIKREGALNSRCWARMFLGTDLDRAKEDCDDAVDADPKNANFLDSRGWVLLRQGKFDRALADFDRSLAINPKLATALYGRGLAKTRLGNAAQGDQDLAAARKLQPEVERRMAPTGLVAASAGQP